MADRKENSIRFSTSVDSTPERVAAVAKMFKGIFASVSGDGTVTMTVANRQMVTTLNPRDPAARTGVSRLVHHIFSPAHAAQSEEGRDVLTQIRDFCRTLPLDSKFEYDNAPPLILDGEYWDQVSQALGDDLDESAIEEETFVYGHVSSVSETGKVKLCLEDGSKYTFRASEKVTNSSAKLFKQNIYAMVTFIHQGRDRKAGELLTISPTEKETNVREAFKCLQANLRKDGIVVTTDWLKD